MIITAWKKENKAVAKQTGKRFIDNYTKKDFKEYCKESIKEVDAELSNLAYISEYFRNNNSIGIIEIPFEKDIFDIKKAVQMLHGKIYNF